VGITGGGSIEEQVRSLADLKTQFNNSWLILIFQPTNAQPFHFAEIISLATLKKSAPYREFDISPSPFHGNQRIQFIATTTSIELHCHLSDLGSTQDGHSKALPPQTSGNPPLLAPHRTFPVSALPHIFKRHRQEFIDFLNPALRNLNRQLLPSLHNNLLLQKNLLRPPGSPKRPSHQTQPANPRLRPHALSRQRALSAHLWNMDVPD